jgi:hypothetical protein
MWDSFIQTNSHILVDDYNWSAVMDMLYEEVYALLHTS